MNKKEQKEKLIKAINKCQSFLETCEGNSNPQVKAMVDREYGMKIAFEAVLDMLQGNYVTINIYSTE